MTHQDGVSYSTEAILLAVVPKVPALFSMLGSSLIMAYIYRRRHKRGKAILSYHRIMFAMSAADLVASLGFFLGTFPIPHDTVGSFGPIYGAVGNDVSCRVMGTYNQLQVLSPLYNGILAIYYLLVVKFRWNELAFQSVENYLHGGAILFAVTTAILGGALDVYGSVDWLCWVTSPHHPEWVSLYRWLFLFAPVWICWILVTGVMITLFVTMRTIENRSMKYSFSSLSNREMSQEIAVQGMLYVVCFYVTWLFPSVQRVLELANVKSTFWLQMLDTSLLPLQGIFNVMVYVRPRYLRIRRRKPEMGMMSLLWHTYGISRRPPNMSFGASSPPPELSDYDLDIEGQEDIDYTRRKVIMEMEASELMRSRISRKSSNDSSEEGGKAFIENSKEDGKVMENSNNKRNKDDSDDDGNPNNLEAAASMGFSAIDSSRAFENSRAFEPRSVTFTMDLEYAV